MIVKCVCVCDSPLLCLAGKADLLKRVPEEFRELMSLYKDYLLQPTRLHTNVFLAEGEVVGEGGEGRGGKGLEKSDYI